MVAVRSLVANTDEISGLMGWWGTHFGENQTWFKPGIAFFSYINRCQTMLRQGSQVCKVCTLNFSPPALSVDALSRSLFQQAVVKNRKITLPDGRTYDVLLLPNTTQMLPRTAQKLQQLVKNGAVVIGPRPLTSPSLTDYPQCDKVVASIGRAIWGDCDGVRILEHRYGKGLVAWNIPLRQVLRQIGVRPNFEITYPTVPLRIVSAVYAAPGHGRRVNVTSILTRILRANGGNHLRLHVDNGRFGGDPAKGYSKVLTLKYRYGKALRTVQIRENSLLSIPSDDVQAVERRTSSMKVFFVANRAGTPTDVTASFQVVGRIPELWNPDTGRRTICANFTDKAGRTLMPLRFAPWGSVFVVFRRPIGRADPVTEVTRNGRPATENLTFSATGRLRMIATSPGVYHLSLASGARVSLQVASEPEPVAINGPWEIKFTPLGAPALKMSMNKLVSWTQLPNPGEKYYSGTAYYTQDFRLSNMEVNHNERIALHLGTVNDLAQVWLNGHDLGVVWHPPFSINITSAARPGLNRLHIAVTNTWANRIIGDEDALGKLEWGSASISGPSYGRPLRAYPKWVIRDMPLPPHLHTFATWNYYRPSSHLLPSGLMGPVRITFARSILVPGVR